VGRLAGPKTFHQAVTLRHTARRAHARMGCSTLSPLDRQRESRSIPGCRRRCMPGWLHKAAFRVDHRERPRWWKADIGINTRAQHRAIPHLEGERTDPRMRRTRR
jgi:hypothetical protein